MTLKLSKLLLVLGLVLAAIGVNAENNSTTRIIDNFTITDFKTFTTKSFARKSRAFNSDPNLGPVWVIVNYIASPKDQSRNGTTTFDIMPEGVPVPAGTSFAIFQSQYMAKFNQENSISITMSGVTKTLSKVDLQKLMSKEDFEKFQESLAVSEKLLQLVQVKTFSIPAKDETDIGVSINTMENMAPSSVEITVGQGPIPAEVQQFIDKTNGSWFYRYRNFLFMIAGSFVLLFFIRRLLAR
ncbi:MAG: hypothetical protein KKH74_09065 [Gammaproteobacteria bacterium]|nr:hypothetical protein [Gammaproteobacteria bacterium]MBU1731889.1 hypothetical protein [Gammaproteobacteria bacterium]MBU1891403.1 hypothetical protein [Gammaproteobacteria bacterium]